jgi:hypothetical protein
VKPVVSKKTQKVNPLGITAAGTVKLSPCAKLYAAALSCPFAWKDGECENKMLSLKIDLTENPCMPLYPAIKSNKVWFYAEGVMGACPGGTPQISVAPWRLANNGNTGNDTAPAIICSKAAGVIGIEAFCTLDTGGAIPPGWDAINFPTPYTTAQLVPGGNPGELIEGRLVACGIEVWYIGKNLDRSGRYVAIEHPDHLSLDRMPLSQINQYTEKYSAVVGPKNKCRLNYSPVDKTDFVYQQDSLSNALWSQDPYHNHFMGVIIPGAPTGGDFWSWRVIVHWEIIGRVVSAKTKSHSDPVGLSAVLNAVNPDKQAVINSDTTVKENLKDYGVDNMTMTGLISKAVPLVSKVAEVATSVLA